MNPQEISFLSPPPRHSKYGVVIARCSQPEVGWLYWRCEEDEFYFKVLESIVNVEIKLDESLGNDSSDNHLPKKKETHSTNGYLGRILLCVSCISFDVSSI